MRLRCLHGEIKINKKNDPGLHIRKVFVHYINHTVKWNLIGKE